MQVLVLLAIVGSTAWLAVDASKRDWSESKVAKNVPTWVVGSLLLWIIVFPLYVFVERKKAPLRAGAEPDAQLPEPEPEPEPEPAPAIALAASRPAEQFGPAIEEEPEPLPGPIVEVEPAAPAVDWAALAAADQEAAPLAGEPADEPPAAPAFAEDTAPGGISLEAFKDIKPVAFGSFAGDDEPEPEPVADAAPQLEPAQPPVEPFADAEPEPEPVQEAGPEPVVALQPFAAPAPEPEPAAPAPVEPPIAAAAAVVAEPATDDTPAKRRRGFKLPSGPQLKLGKLPVSLPPQLRGPLDDLERKIVLGSVVAIVAAAALGYSTAPQEEPAAPAAGPPPAATSR